MLLYSYITSVRNSVLLFPLNQLVLHEQISKLKMVKNYLQRQNTVCCHGPDSIMVLLALKCNHTFMDCEISQIRYTHHPDMCSDGPHDHILSSSIITQL